LQQGKTLQRSLKVMGSGHGSASASRECGQKSAFKKGQKLVFYSPAQAPALGS